MMRALLFLGLVGLVLYGFLVIIENALSGGETKNSTVIQTLPNHSVGEKVSSWGSYLPSRVSSQNPTQQSVALPSQESDERGRSMGGTEVAASGNKAALPEGDALKASTSIDGKTSITLSEKPATKPLAAKSVNRKLSKRITKHRTVVADAYPWTRRAERRPRFGLFMFRPVPRFMGR